MPNRVVGVIPIGVLKSFIDAIDGSLARTEN